MKNVSINASAAVSFDGDQESMENPTVDYYFNDFLPPHHEHMDLETESMANKNHQFDPEVNLMSLNWERPTPSYMLSDCFFEIDTTLDGVVDGALEPTEVSEDEMDSDSSSSLEHRFEETAKRLAEYMKKSRQSRLSLTLNSPAVAQYPRKKSISNVVISVEESSQQILTTFGGFRSSTPSSNL